MTRPKPIRYDQDTWLVMRTNPVIPKAVIQRIHHKVGDRYLVLKWDIDPANRELMTMCTSLEKADELVLYDKPVSNPDDYWNHWPNNSGPPRKSAE
ncbi:MAG: hypothetical protein EPN48_15330 [Microbacteriaceae bacterium]|nr:MAG: hypothetical protein EPN48_15330 [Microbacteriaceae bacterium]